MAARRSLRALGAGAALGVALAAVGAPAAKPAAPAKPAVLETIVNAAPMVTEEPPVQHVYATSWPVVVVAHFTVDRVGKVRVDAVNPVEVPTEMRTAARKAVAEWRFWPALGACRHVEQSGTAEIVYDQSDVKVKRFELLPLAPSRKLPAADFAWLDPADPGDPRPLLRASGPGYVETVPLKIVPPRYPTTASREALPGYAFVMLLIGTDGRVLQAKATDAWSPDPKLAPQFGAEAVRAMKQWKFQPATQDGKPLQRWACRRILFNMTLAKPR